MAGTANPTSKESLRNTLNYWAETAHILGALRNDEDQPIRNNHHGGKYFQENYSVFWYFDYLRSRPIPSTELNQLTKAFLGIEDQLQFDNSEAEPSLENLLPTDKNKSELNPAQRAAISTALRNPISLIQGPPGTGKTHTILNLVSEILDRGQTAAVVATNREALNNISEKAAEYSKLAVAYARLGGSTQRASWKPLPPAQLYKRNQYFDFGTNNWTGPTQKNPEATHPHPKYATGGWESEISAEDFLGSYPFITSTIHSLKKCFSDGDTHQYDYVIIDEASQCSVMLGLMAMSNAKHLVLVGDREQLQPIFNTDFSAEIAFALNRARVSEQTVGANYRLQRADSGDGMSILEAVERQFAGRVPSTFLNEHYRCHPGIIGFCADEIYTTPGEELQVSTQHFDNTVPIPIRVCWFEGNYAESGPPPENLNPQKKQRLSKVNAKQLQIFMREEWPGLKKRLEADQNLTVSILSPYRAQLLALEEAIKQDIEDSRSSLMGHDTVFSEEVSKEVGTTAQDPLVPKNLEKLTIHKAQGKEFDIVYLLPVEDGLWEWPWSQGKNLINVAVSRAKKELVVITSSNLMSPELQKALVNYDSGAPSKRRTATEQAEADQQRKQNLFVQRLIDYVARKGQPKDQEQKEIEIWQDGPFGFHRTGMTSVFDKADMMRDYVREKFPDMSSYEYVFMRALEKMLRKYPQVSFEMGVRIQNCFPEMNWDQALTDSPSGSKTEKLELIEGYGDPDKYQFHFDFVLYEGSLSNILLAIELDGEQHRTLSKTFEVSNEEQIRQYQRRQETDELKNLIVEDLGGQVIEGLELGEPKQPKPKFRLLRLKTNGVTWREFDLFYAAAMPPRRNTVDAHLEQQLNR